MTLSYRGLRDGSGIVTEVLEDGTIVEHRLPSPWAVDRGPSRNTSEDEAAIRRAEDRITELDRRDRK